MNNIRSIKESIRGIQEKLNGLIGDLKRLDIFYQEIQKQKTLDMYPAIITLRVYEELTKFGIVYEELTKFGIVNVVDLSNYRENEELEDSILKYRNALEKVTHKNPKPIVTLEMLIECLNLMELQCDIFIRMEQTILGSESKEKC